MNRLSHISASDIGQRCNHSDLQPLPLRDMTKAAQILIRPAYWAAVAFVCVATVPSVAQAPGSSSTLEQATGPATVQAAQQTLQTVNAQTGVGSSVSATPNDYKGSLVEGKSTGSMMDLSLDAAIQSALRTNLGLILESSAEKNAAGARLQALQALLPTVNGSASYTIEQVNLAAYGLKFPGINPIIGPFQVFDFRASLTQSLVNVSSIQKYLASRHNFQAEKLTADDARNLVVLTVGNAYLLCIADQARIEAVQSEMESSKVSLDQASAAHEAGTSPKLDVLRAQVDYQNQQQQLIASQNSLAKDKLALARVIGLPLDQEFRLTDSVPYAALEHVDADAAFQQALTVRKDLKAAEERYKAASAQKSAAWAEQLPEAHFSGDFGDLGTTPNHSHSTYTAKGEVTAPILQIAKTRGDILVADAQKEQAKARLSDQIQQVNQDIHDSVLDINATEKLVEAAKSNVDLASEALTEAQDRFKSGISDNLAVSQAQSQVSQAHDQYISALYQHNIAKLSLARALGIAEGSYKNYLGGK